jgi:2-deoxy-D-gluconate 3-dehydrogenase
MIDPLEVRDLSRTEDFLKVRVLTESRTEPLILAREVVLISGGNSGIGLGMVHALLKRGFRVAVLDSSRENLISLQVCFSNLLVLRCNVTDSEELKTALDLIVRKWGRIDVLVNIIPDPESYTTSNPSLEKTRECMERGFFLPLKILLEVLPQMQKQQKGIVHNVISPMALVGLKGSFPYCALSGALEAMSRSLAMDTKRDGVDINIMLKSVLPSKKKGKDMLEGKVGESLAREILTIKPVISPDFATSLFAFFARRFPYFLGRISSWLIRSGLIEP